jgi:hypothetical protein
MQLLEVMVDDDVALCLTPQAFNNVNPATDIFNNTNQVRTFAFLPCVGQRQNAKSKSHHWVLIHQPVFKVEL